MDFTDTYEIPVVLEVAPRRGKAWLAWTVILALVALIIGLSSLRPSAKHAEGEDNVGLVILEVQGRQMVGTTEFTGRDARLAEQARTLDTGPVSHRLRYIVLVGELAGPDEALKRLEDLNRKL